MVVFKVDSTSGGSSDEADEAEPHHLSITKWVQVLNKML